MNRDRILCMSVTFDYKYIFIAGKFGFQQQFDIGTQELVKDYKYVYDHFDLGDIKSIIISPDSKYLFTSNTTGHIKQFSIPEQHELKDLGRLYDGEITCIKFTSDFEYLLIGGKEGLLKQISTSEIGIIGCSNWGKETFENDAEELIVYNQVKDLQNNQNQENDTSNDANTRHIKSEDFNKSDEFNNQTKIAEKKVVIYDLNCEETAESPRLQICLENLEIDTSKAQIYIKYEILDIAVSNSKDSVYVCGTNKQQKEISIGKECIVKDFKVMFNRQSGFACYEQTPRNDITSVVCTQDGKYLFAGTSDSQILQFSIKDESLVKDYKMAHSSGVAISCMGATPDSMYLFSCDCNGCLRMWSVNEMELHKDFGDLFEGEIYCLAISY